MTDLPKMDHKGLVHSKTLQGYYTLAVIIIQIKIYYIYIYIKLYNNSNEKILFSINIKFSV